MPKSIWDLWTQRLLSLAFRFARNRHDDWKKKAIPAANLLLLPSDNQRKRRNHTKRLEAELLQSIANKFNFNSCLWINVSNHRANVQSVSEWIPTESMRERIRRGRLPAFRLIRIFAYRFPHFVPLFIESWSFYFPSLFASIFPPGASRSRSGIEFHSKKTENLFH